MPSDPSIALGVRPIAPPVSPLATIGALQNIQEGQARQALLATQQREAEANTADIDQKTQQANRLNQAYAKAADILRDPAESEKFGTGDISSLRKAGIDPKVVDDLHSNVLDGLVKISTKSKTDFDLHQEQLGKLMEGITGLKLWAKQNPEGDLQGVYSAYRNSANTELKLAPGTLPDASAVRQIGDLDGIAAKTGLYLGMHNKVQADRANEQKILTDAAQGNNLQADADRTNLLAPLEKDAKSIDNEQHKRTLTGTGATGITAEKQAELDATAKRDAAAAANAAGHLKIARDTYDKTFGPGALNQALIGVQPHMIGPATAAAQKAGEEYAAAAQVSDSMKTMLDMAAKGNKAAGSNLPLVGVETLNAINGIKRINGAEIAQYGSAGNLLDKIQGRIGKLTTGQSIPQDVMDDIRALHTELDKGAKEKYANKIQIVNQNFNSKFKPVEFHSNAESDPKTSYVQGHIYGGLEFLGGDPNSAASWKKAR